MKLSLRSSILSTLAYADIFSYPLEEQELWKYLIGPPTTLKTFRETLARLKHKKNIAYRDGYYCLPNRFALIGEREKRKRASRRKFTRAQYAARILAHIPTIWCIGISGSLAMGNTRPEDDIDFFLITAPHTLWLTRFLANTLMDALGLRRKPHEKHVQDKICLNMFYDGSRLLLPVRERDLFSAHEIVQMVCLFERYDTYARFLRENIWTSHFLPHAKSVLRAIGRAKTQWYSRLGLLEQLCKAGELWYMKNKQTGEVIGSTMLRFHPVDARVWIKEALRMRLRKYNLPLDKIFYAS